MKITLPTTTFLLLSSTVTSLSIPETGLAPRHSYVITSTLVAPDLEKRRGGGGRGGGGGGGGRGGGSGSSAPSRSSPSSNLGGATHSGSGPKPAYGGGTYYGGGSTTPFKSGAASPKGISPYYVAPAGLLFFPGVWYSGAYLYPYSAHYYYRNTTSERNESLPVTCMCQQYQVCGCDDNTNKTYYESLFGGTQPVNTSVVRVVNVNDTETIVINGTLPNGTTAADSTLSLAISLTLMQASGYWVMVAVVVNTVWAI